MKFKSFKDKANVIGKNIKKYRELRGYSQRELSNRLALLGVTIYHAEISRIENQKLFIKDYEILALCRALNITKDELFENTDNIFD